MNKTTLNSQKEKHSMLSLRRAMSVALPGLRLHLDFYPRSPCGERHHSRGLNKAEVIFLSTLSLRRATKSIETLRTVKVISIHALLAESDEQAKALKVSAHDISIHALLAESDFRQRNQ